MSFSKCSNVILRGQNVIFEGGREGEGRGKGGGRKGEEGGRGGVREGLEILSNTNVKIYNRMKTSEIFENHPWKSDFSDHQISIFQVIFALLK